MPKRIYRNGRMVTEERTLELATLSDKQLLMRLDIASRFCEMLDEVEAEFGWKWRGHERSHWPLRAGDYMAEAEARGLLFNV